ncbi:Diadenosine tetraphosphatase [Patulibacter medicamentivorans]|uniref:Diadenosine tetraphosphatase n=1 Tax=Patulibacter medicamentivorans TaxID=1097667 RepID=H0E684_9ACTN|nr:metallophosphoesterase family protein [Patulibacter medicamentivorans]EHN10853.1 Diadenosine tetraphosphatase [Patulibacter medicamentivorans]
MHVAVLSDIHGNRHALDAVLADADDRGCEEIWCLGDIVGYGADPNGCCAAIRQFATVCLAGNHDLVAIGTLSSAEFTPDAAAAAAWTRDELRPEHREWLAGLQPSGSAQGCALAHGSPLHPIWEYVLSNEQAERSLEAFDEQVALIGHSHVALSFAKAGLDPVQLARRDDGDEVLLGARRWLLNPGSVGQPRDEDPRAAWLELDPVEGRAVWHRVRYDVEGAARAIRDARLPPSLADRLQFGR